uniref:UMOD/GP2/OIT3-like D8C domain-containing protein n=1 Tax=Lates calcarifer TaxID=8187 RepID=A0A4W6ECL4_LATCA
MCTKPFKNISLGSCDGYTNITEPWRNQAFTSTSFPGFPRDDAKLVNNWWRFTGIGGDRVIPSCIASNRGGTARTVYIPSTYPTTESETPTRVSAYGSWNGCYNTQFAVNVALCPGGFYVYKPLSHTSANTGYVTCELFNTQLRTRSI